MEELERQAGWAKTFGLPMDLIDAQAAQDRFPLMSTEGVLGAVWLPTDGWLDPSGLAQALAAGARAARRVDPDRATGRRHRRRARSRVRGDRRTRRRAAGHRDRHRGQRRWHVRAGDRRPGRRHRADHPDGAPVPVHRSDRRRGPGLPQLRDPDNLVYFREEVGGLCMGGYERDPAPWSLDGVPPDFNGKLLAPDLPRFEPIMEGAIRRVPAMADARVSRIINGPEAFTPGQRVHPGRVGRARVLARRRVLRARDRRRGWHRSPGGELDRRRRARARPVEDGHPPVRGGLSVAARTRSPARSRTTRPTTTSTTRTRSARPAGPLRTSPTYERSGRARGGRSGRSPAGSGRTGSSRTPTIRGSAAAESLEALRPRGWAGQHWSPAIAAEALATRQAAALFDETSFAKLEVVGPGACCVPPAGVRRTTSTVRSGRSCTRSCSIGVAVSRPI